MWRAPLVFLSLLLIAWLEFAVYPGHTYLAGDSQLYLPVLIHLHTPAYLTRDLVATHPRVAFTAYDEITLFLHSVGKLNFEQALLLEQAVCRLAALAGVFLLGRAAGLRHRAALLVAALLNLGALLPGPEISLVGLEPTPRALAFGLVLLAMGCLATGKPLLAGLSGGLALLFDPLAAAPYWLMLLVGSLVDQRLRKYLRPMAPLLLIFVLLLANLAQLQPGTPDAQPFFGRFSSQLASIEQVRSPDLWVSLWPAKYVYLYLAAYILAIWASARVWNTLNRPLKWMFAALPLLGLCSMLFSLITAERLHWAEVLRLKPLQMLVYTVLFLLFATFLAGVRAWQKTARVEAALWFVLCFTTLLGCAHPLTRHNVDPAVAELAVWAENGTWGSSMFLFPDAGRNLYPGVFRAASRRAVWADWQSGGQVNEYVALAPEWWQRWQSTMAGPLSAERLQSMLALPIDYFVVGRNCLVGAASAGQHRLLTPAFANRSFAVYEASALRTVPGTLTVQFLGNFNPPTAAGLN